MCVLEPHVSGLEIKTQGVPPARRHRKLLRNLGEAVAWLTIVGSLLIPIIFGVGAASRNRGIGWQLWGAGHNLWPQRCVGHVGQEEGRLAKVAGLKNGPFCWGFGVRWPGWPRWPRFSQRRAKGCQPPAKSRARDWNGLKLLEGRWRPWGVGREESGARSQGDGTLRGGRATLRRGTYLIVKDHRAIGAQAHYGGQCILRGRCGMGGDNGVETRSDEDTKDGRGEHDDGVSS